MSNAPRHRATQMYAALPFGKNCRFRPVRGALNAVCSLPRELWHFGFPMRASLLELPEVAQGKGIRENCLSRACLIGRLSVRSQAGLLSATCCRAQPGQ